MESQIHFPSFELPFVHTLTGEIPHSAIASFGMTGCYGSGRGREGDFASQNHLPFPYYDPNEFVIPNGVRDLQGLTLSTHKVALIRYFGI